MFPWRPSKRSLRIVLLTPAYPPFVGGGEQYVRSLAQALTAAGQQVTVITSSATAEQDFWSPNPSLPQQPTIENDGGVIVIRCPLRPWVGGATMLGAWRKAMGLLSFSAASEPLLKRMMSQFPPVRSLGEEMAKVLPTADVIHGFNVSWENPLITGWRLAQTQRIPFIVTPFAHLGAAYGDRAARNSTMPHQLRVLRTAAAVLTLTTVSKKGLIAYGVPEEKITVIGGGLEPLPATWPPEKAIREKFALNGRYALFIGRATVDKGALQAADSVSMLNEQGHELTLVLAGRTSPEFERFYQRLPADKRLCIRPLGSVSEQDKHGLLAAAEMLLLPSKADSFGIVILEAWAHGKPVIAAQAGGIPGVIDEGENGLLVPFGDTAALTQAIASLLTNPSLSRTIGAAGYTKVTQQYSWPQVAARVLNCYHSFFLQPL